MSTKQRKPKDFVSDMKFLRSNKLSIGQSVAFFSGLSYELILNKEIFPKNSDLEIFINEVFLVHSKKDDYFKSYLYSSRTALGSRLTRTILDEYDYSLVKKVSFTIENILNTRFNLIANSSPNKTNKFNNNLDLWITSLSNYDDKE